MKLSQLRNTGKIQLPILTEDAPKDSNKVTRAAFVYLEHRDGSYGDEDCFAQCETCRLWTGDEHKTCMILGESFEVVGHGSCNVYVNGKPHPEWHGHEEERMTPEEAGYVVREVRCENCVAFKPGDDEHGTCQMFAALNDANPEMFDLDEKVYHAGCCNSQTPKS